MPIKPIAVAACALAPLLLIACSDDSLPPPPQDSRIVDFSTMSAQGAAQGQNLGQNLGQNPDQNPGGQMHGGDLTRPPADAPDQDLPPPPPPLPSPN